MIPVANITLEDALLDNPNFRANIKLFEAQVFFVENWLVSLQRSMAQFTEEWKRLNEVTSVLNKQAEVPLLSQGMLSSQHTIPAMKLTGEALRTTLALKNNYISEVNEKVLKPLDDFLKVDLKDFKDSKKSFDKALEKYESALTKYNAQNRQKEPSALREEAFQLYDTRKAYIQAAMSCSMLCIKFQDALDQLVLGVFLDLIATQHDYFSGNADHFGSMALQVLQLKTYMKEHKEASGISLQELEQNKERYTADAIEHWKPSRSLKCYSNNIPAPASRSTIGHAVLGPAFAAQVGGQINLNTIMARPATISQFTTTGNSRQPLPTQQIQSRPSMTAINATAAGQQPKNAQPPPSESLQTSDALTINTTLGKDSNSSSWLSLSNSTTASPPPNAEEHTLGDFTPTTKQGYLNIRIPQSKTRAPVWKRKYFFIQEGEFGFESVVSNPTVGSQVVQSERISVLLCEVRYGSSSSSLMALNGVGTPASGSQGLAVVQMERRFCFEVVCATQTYLLQAEAEDDLMSWVSTFEAAKRESLMQQGLPRRPEADEPYSPIPDSANPSFSFSGEDVLKAAQLKSSEAEESKPSGPLGLAWAANVPGVSLLLGSYTGNNSPSNGKDEISNEPSTGCPDSADKNSEQEATQDSLQTTSGTDIPRTDSTQGLGITANTNPRPPTLDTDASTHLRSWSVGDVPTNSEQRSGHSHQLSEIEKLMTSSLHLVPKPTPLAVAEIPHYPMELVVRNRELHLRFHGTKIHSKEYVLHSWTSGYRDDTRPDKPIMIHGRIYLTQSGMYFYTRTLSVETKRMYRFSIIRGIECEQKDISTEWRIETVDGVQHVFSQFTLADTEYQVLHLIWTNAHQQKDRLPVKELFRRTMLITNKPKGIAGSGSLAETESSHLTNRGGTMTHPSGQPGKITASIDGIESKAVTANDDDEDWRNLDEDLPASIEVPSSPVACGCAGHLEKVELDQTFNIPAKTLNRLLFGDSSPIWKEFHERRSNKVQNIGDWEKTGDHRTRVVKFLMVVNNPLVKLNQADCVETQACEVEEAYLRYSYTTRSSVLAMPYSDAFTPVVRYCITFVNKNQCKLTCSIGIEWHKNPLVKAMIKGAVFKGTAETIKDVAEIIQLHLEHREPHSILLSPQNEIEQPNYMVDSSKDHRVLGIRRHTVSTGAGPVTVPQFGPRVHGRWLTGSQPSFVPIGSKASRTRLLGKPSRSTLIDQTSKEAQTNKAKAEEAKGIFGWFKKYLFGFTSVKKDRRSLSTTLLYLVLLVSSLINIWAAYNTQRMLRPKEYEPNADYDGLLDRVFNHDHTDGPIRFNGDSRNVRVAARAVYLRDLEELMQSGELEGFDGDEQKIDQKSFETFLEVRDMFRSTPEWFADQNVDHSASEETSTSLASPQPSSSPDPSVHDGSSTMTRNPSWLLPHHRRWATWTTFQRDKVGILRHDLLLTFGMLRQLERRLLEAEYFNWIMDEKSRCRLWERRRVKDGTVDDSESKEVFQQGSEMEQDPSYEEVDKSKEIRLDHHAEVEDAGETRRERAFKDQIAKEFCESLERQVELLK
ncbi:SNF1-interacting protein [Modicella reniformis]|uniref:SNF1-interacting protein n=1 Tax=Modicella reniformis TaxID=1440133 RepID=A0A9P6MB78_9FUNG|nr:SNF1-interacting protein [Modicella reniformis]